MVVFRIWFWFWIGSPDLHIRRWRSSPNPTRIDRGMARVACARVKSNRILDQTQRPRASPANSFEQ